MSSPASQFSPFGEPILQLAPRAEDLISNDHDALNTITILERVGSILSLLGSLFVIVTFLTSHAFHKPVNRLVFYASFGNLMTNVGTLMSRAFVDNPTSPGCQFQGFLIQMFMPADSLWTLSMAINVYLTFYYKFDADKLRRMELPYLVFNYGVPFVPAFVYIFISDGGGNRVYGNAKLWCWVTPEWGIWRIITFYAPVWLVIATTMFIYLRAGRTIYNKRMQLYDLSGPETETDPFSTKTTEVSVTSEAIDSVDGIVPAALTVDYRRQHRGAAAYSVTITAEGGTHDTGSSHDTADPRDTGDQGESGGRSGSGSGSAPNTKITIGNVRGGTARHQRRRNMEMNTAAWSYTKCAILFFTAMLITWIPSSANRVYSVLNEGRVLVGLEYASAFVLPLQGLWNCLIYIVTSWTGCKNYFRELGLTPQPSSQNSIAMRPTDFGSRRVTSKRFETESMTELQNSRSSSVE